MSCRETSSGSAFTSYARLVAANGQLSDPAVLSTFHELRRVYTNRDENTRRTYTPEDYQALLRRQIQRVQNSNLSEAKKRSILARLQRAQQEETPPQDILYALHNLTPTVRSRAQARTSFISDIAMRMGVPFETAQQRFNEYESRAVRSRSRTPEGYSEENQQLAARYNLGRDVGIVTAVAGMTRETIELEIRRARSQPQRIVLEDIPAAQQTIPGTTLTITSHGYDPRDGRYQVTVHDSATGETSEYAYQNTPNPETDLNGRSIAQRWYENIRGNEQYAYANEHEAATRGIAERCTNCGQFSDNRHSCPVPAAPVLLSMNTTQSRWSRQRATMESTSPIAVYNSATGGWEAQIAPMETVVTLPAIRELRNAVQSNPIRITGISANVSSYGCITQADGSIRPDYRTPYLRGEATVYRDDAGELQINTGNLACSCAEYRDNRYCQHQTLVAQAIRERVDRPRSVRQARTPEERERILREAQARAEQAALTDWTRNEETLQEAQRTWRDDAEVLYSENPELFAEDIEQALTRAAAKNGEPDIPYMRENVLDGYARRGSGQAFGVEIEFDLPPGLSYTERNAAISRIAQDLYDAGITYSNRQERYGASRGRGFVDVHTDDRGIGTWSFEHDGSVTGGELVTAGMYDEPETWEKLEKAVEIIKRHGGTASRKAGAHVHVGTGTYRGSTQKYTELARIVAQHEDVLFRLASDTKRGTHRKNRYTGPTNTPPAEDFSDVTSVRRWSGSRYTALNMQAVSGSDNDHPEFRLFDSSLDPGTIQSQIKLAVGLVNAADRIAASGGTSRGKEQWGAHKARQQARGTRRRMTAEELAEDSATTRSLLDTLFRRRSDKAQLAAVFAHTKWVTSSR